MIDSVAGALVRPMPEPMKTIARRSSGSWCSSMFVEAQASPIASETSPPATTSLVPLRTASRVPSTEVIPVNVATGSSLTPVESGP